MIIYNLSILISVCSHSVYTVYYRVFELFGKRILKIIKKKGTKILKMPSEWNLMESYGILFISAYSFSVIFIQNKIATVMVSVYLTHWVDKSLDLNILNILNTTSCTYYSVHNMFYILFRTYYIDELYSEHIILVHIILYILYSTYYTDEHYSEHIILMNILFLWTYYSYKHIIVYNIILNTILNILF